MLSHYPGIAPLPRKVSRTSWAACPGPARRALAAVRGMRPANEPSAAGAGPAADEASPALPLRADEVLYAFKCEWDSICSFWEEDGGANAVFTVPRAELADGPTAPPAHAEDGAPEILPELVVADWRIADDGAPAELESAFYDYGLHDGLPDEIAHPHDWASEWRTKFGGVPYWTANGAQGVPAGRLLLQIDNWVQLEDGGSTEVANFCSDGTAYIFVDRSREAPVYTMIINR